MSTELLRKYADIITEAETAETHNVILEGVSEFLSAVESSALGSLRGGKRDENTMKALQKKLETLHTWLAHYGVYPDEKSRALSTVIRGLGVKSLYWEKLVDVLPSLQNQLDLATQIQPIRDQSTKAVEALFAGQGKVFQQYLDQLKDLEGKALAGLQKKDQRASSGQQGGYTNPVAQRT